MAWVAPVVLVALALIAGCGGGDEAGDRQGAAGTAGQDEAQGGGSRGSSEAEGGPGADGGSSEGRAGEAGGGEESSRRGEGTGSGGAGEQSGEGSSPGGEATAPPAKTSFVRRANAICARSAAERSKALARYARSNSGKPATERVEGSLQEIYVPALEAQVAKLRRLTPPRGDEGEVEAIIDAIGEWAAATRRGGASEKDAIDQAINRASALARRYGLARCVSE